MSFSTWLYTRLFGELVGMDEYGNNYYCARQKNQQGRERRWVLFKDEVEPSLVPPEWHAWLHHTIDRPLSEHDINLADWQLEHRPNLTGTSKAYRPGGDNPQEGAVRTKSSDYDAWIPD